MSQHAARGKRAKRRSISLLGNRLLSLFEEELLWVADVCIQLSASIRKPVMDAVVLVGVYQSFQAL